MSWLYNAIAAYGEPKIRQDVAVEIRRDNGTSWRRCWVWFPGDPARNHNIAIDEYRQWLNFKERTTFSRWVVSIQSHLTTMPSVEWSSRTEPDDELMNQLMALTGFLATPVAAVTPKG